MGISNEKLAELLRYIGDDLSASERLRLESELRRSSELRNCLERIRVLSSALMSDDYPGLKESTRLLQKRVLEQVRDRLSTANRKKGVATYDSMLLPLPTGVRPATVSTRQLRFTNDEAELVMSLYPVTSASYQLIGQVSAPGRSSRLMIGLQSGRSRFRVQSNDFQVFRIDRVPAGEFKLSVYDGEELIMSVELEL